MAFSKRQLQIIDEALTIITEEGIQNLTTKKLAFKVGVTEPALYRHFKNKTDIILGILKYFEENSDFIITETESMTLKSLDKIEKFLFSRFDLFEGNPKLAKLMFSEAIFDNEAILAQKMLSIMHKHAQSMIKIIVSGQEKSEIVTEILPVDIFRMIFGSFRLVSTQWVMSRQAFNLKQEGNRLWQSLKKLLLNSR